MNKKIIYWIPAAMWMTLIFLLTSTPGNTLPSMKMESDKLAHFAVYSVLSYLLIFALINTVKKEKTFCFFSAFMIAFVYGTMEEYHQLFIPKRYFSYADMYANMIGSVAGVLFWHFNPGGHREKLRRILRNIL